MTSAAGLRIAILGGGTAGWMTACLMAEAWPAASITLIEAPDIGIVGVGEGSTPQLAGFFARMGIAEPDWMPRAEATYKTGIAFHGWAGERGPPSYFHPFTSALDPHTQPQFHFNNLMRRRGEAVDTRPDRFFLAARLAASSKAPLPARAFPFAAHHGYHFDAHLIGAVMHDEATRRGVVHRRRRMTMVERHDDGDVAALLLDDGDRLIADLFVDASGFRAAIMTGAIGGEYRSFGENLFCDAAVTIQTPHAEAPLRPQTDASALSAGWAWAIPLAGRVGNGYVYASRYLDRDDAEAELRRHLGIGDGVPARHLAMRVGRLADSWRHNCLAVGLAQGFIEPLEATALHLVQATVDDFVAAYAGGGFGAARRDRFNAVIAQRYEGVRDYIVCHYAMNGRRDTAFWRDNAANTERSDSLCRLIACWEAGGDLVAEVERQSIGGYYAALSWECLLAGYGCFPAGTQPAPDRVDLPGLDRFLDACLLNFPDHAAVIAAQHRA